MPNVHRSRGNEKQQRNERKKILRVNFLRFTTCYLLGSQEAFDDCSTQVNIFISHIPTKDTRQINTKREKKNS